MTTAYTAWVRQSLCSYRYFLISGCSFEVILNYALFSMNFWIRLFFSLFLGATVSTLQLIFMNAPKATAVRSPPPRDIFHACRLDRRWCVIFCLCSRGDLFLSLITFCDPTSKHSQETLNSCGLGSFRAWELGPASLSTPVCWSYAVRPIVPEVCVLPQSAEPYSQT